MNKLFSISLGMLLAGCASMSTVSDAQKVELGCASAAASLKVLTVANMEHKLSKEAQEEVTAAVLLIRPVCSAEHAPALNDVQRRAFDAALGLIAARAAKVGD